MSDMQSIIFLKNLMKNYSGDTLKQQLLDRKNRRGMCEINEKRFAGLLPQEQLAAMRHNISDSTNNKCFTLLKEKDYIKSQYNKRSKLLEEADLKKVQKRPQ